MKVYSNGINKCTAVFLAVILAIMLAGCNTPASQGSLALIKQQAKDYFRDCQLDIDTMNGAVDQLTAFFENDFLDAEDINYEATVQDIQGIRDELTPILSVSAGLFPENSPLEQYTQLKFRCAKNLDEILMEIQGILNYEEDLLYALDPLTDIENMDYNNLESAYDQIGTICDEINQRTESIMPPTFLQYLHEGLCEGTGDYLAAMQDLIASACYYDPLRMNTYVYQLGVL